jgi:hypothetical protein
MLMRAVIDEGRRLNKPVYFFFADLVKCFDRLWLKDCLNDLHDCGMREREIGLIYKLNQEAHFKVNTPAGITQEIVVKEIVKQGTVYGPKLCCGSTGKINEGIKEVEIIYPTVSIKALAYVDDIEAGGARKLVKDVMEQGKEMEKDKLWEFSVEKSKWMCIEGRQKAEEIDVEVAQGKLERTKEYKALGNMVNDKGNLDSQLEFMEKKTVGIIREGRKMCCRSRVGKSELDAKKFVYEILANKSIFHNMEAWTNFRKKDITKLISIEGKVIRGLFGLPKTTPYWGMMHELGIWPITLTLTYRKMMVYHNLINSDDERLAKVLVEAQEESEIEECWFAEVRKEAREIGIELQKEIVKGKAKSTWKREVKEKIKDAEERLMAGKRENSTKMRFLETKGCETYLKEVWNEDARMALKIRLNSIEWIDGNVGKQSPCPLCMREMDTTEHVFSCNEGGEKEVTVKDLENGEKMRKVVELFKRNEERRRTLLTDELEIKMVGIEL